MKIWVILLIILLILSGILAFKILNGNNNDIIPKETSQLEVKQLLKKAEEYDNYILKYNMNGEETTKIVKGNIVILKTSKLYLWQNLDTNERISISPDLKTAVTAKESSSSLIPVEKELTFQDIALNYIDNSDYSYKYIKDDIYNGSKCIVIQFETIPSNSSIEGNILTTIWIDKSTGVALKFETEAINTNGQKVKEVLEYNIQLNIVNDNDVQRPDLSAYKVSNLDTVIQHSK